MIRFRVQIWRYGVPTTTGLVGTNATSSDRFGKFKWLIEILSDHDQIRRRKNQPGFNWCILRGSRLGCKIHKKLCFLAGNKHHAMAMIRSNLMDAIINFAPAIVSSCTLFAIGLFLPG